MREPCDPKPFAWRSGGGLERLDPDWWTLADQAELNILIAAMCDGLAVHEEKHGAGCCCKPGQRIIELVLEWRSWRVLNSKAEYLRAIQQARVERGQP